jgi:hypothetical protein
METREFYPPVFSVEAQPSKLRSQTKEMSVSVYSSTFPRRISAADCSVSASAFCSNWAVGAGELTSGFLHVLNFNERIALITKHSFRI